MYAWRARIGLVHPTHRGKVFAFWYDHAPEGVELVPTFIGFRKSNRSTFAAGIQRAEELAAELVDRGCNLVAVSGTPPFLLKGLEYEQRWGEELSRKIGVPVVTPMEPHAIALKAMGAETVAIASYYGEELNNAIAGYLNDYGFKSYALGGYGSGDQAEALYTTSLSALDEVSYMQVYQYCKAKLEELAVPVDALYLNGAGWDAAPAIDYLERDLGVKVVYALAAEMWLAYHKLSISNLVENRGSLLRDGFAPAKA